MSERLAAIMMVRNEANIIADSIGNLLTGVGVDTIYVADNGSTDETPDILRRIAALDARVRVRSAPGAFRQTVVIGGLIAEAIGAGADWLLPTDADEFHWPPGGVRAHLARSGDVGAFLLPVCNFVRFRGGEDRPGAIEMMLMSARPSLPADTARQRVCDGRLRFLQLPYPAKLILRAAPDLQLTPGQHGALGIVGPIRPAGFCELLHAPMRSRGDLDNRVEHGRRVRAMSADPDHSWHLTRLVAMDAAGLDAEWRANSVGLDLRSLAGFRPDLRLARLGRRQRSFRRAVSLAGAEPRRTPARTLAAS